VEKLVLGIDIGTSSIKTLAVNDKGHIIASASSPLTIQHAYPGYSEQQPDEWFSVTIETMREVINDLKQTHSKFEINGISFSGQMHGLIVLDEAYKVIRPAILWNDTRSTAQCEEIKSQLGDIVLGNPVLEGFTLTDTINMELSDASSTLLLDPVTNKWSEDVGRRFDIANIYPPLVTSDTQVGYLKQSIAEELGITNKGLIFAPYLAGERTPHGDANIRGSFIGLSGMHSFGDMARAVVEGITYSLYESIAYLRTQGKHITEVVAIGGGAKSDFWLQLQADVFNAKVYKLKHEEGPSMGAAMIAATGLKWYDDIASCVEHFIHKDKIFEPNKERHVTYQSYFDVYKAVYNQTQPLTKKLLELTKESAHH
jgi:sugar (pentulose or hexulose) kinase